MSKDAWSRYQHLGATRYDVVMPGFKYNMPDLQAAIGLHQLTALGEHLARRDATCRRYDEAFVNLPIGRFADLAAPDVHARHLYTILVDQRTSGLSRDELAAAMAECGVASSIHFPAVHLHRYYVERFGFSRGQFPHAERIADTVLSLPLSPAHTDSQVEAVISAVKAAFRS